MDSSDGGRNNENRRVAPRISAQDLPQLGLKLFPGGSVKLLDLSQSGVRFECDRRLMPAARVALQIVSSDGSLTIHGRVIRVRLTRVERSQICYEVAMAFERLVDSIGLPASAAEVPVVAPVAEPAATFAGSAEEPATDDIAELTAALSARPASSTVDPDMGDISELLLTAYVAQSRQQVWQVINGNEW